jgi:hypothetical protein
MMNENDSVWWLTWGSLNVRCERSGGGLWLGVR